jgi:hypothetical protein
MPKKHYRCYSVTIEETCRRRDLLHLYQTGLPIEDVTIILSKQQRHSGPKQTKILLANLPEVTVHHVVDVYQYGLGQNSYK